jgi:hypothetical protein
MTDKPINNWTFQFISMVQTAIITKYVCDPGDGTVPIARPMWAIEHIEAAFMVAANIHPEFSPREAAEAFIRWTFSQPLEPNDKVMLKIVLRNED